MPCHFAGSAIAQGPDVGRIDRWLEWNPTSEKCKWLLLSGASNPPSGIDISDRRTRDIPGVKGGTFLSGVTHDLANMERAVGTNLFNTVRDLYFTKSAALGHIQKLFDICKRDVQPILYYTGHGELGTGNWCFDDGTISIQEILDMRPEGAYYPMIFSDSCYSGHWANFCLKKNITGFHCLAACPEYFKAIDTKDEGGDLTLFMTGKKARPGTEPMYSGGNRNDFPITTGYDSVKYKDLIASHIRNSDNIVICQSFHNSYLSGCFAPSESYRPRPRVSWMIRYDSDSFLEKVNENQGKSTQIYSLTIDEKAFGAFFMADYGTHQTIVTNLSDIEKKREDGFDVTACAARDSTFYIIMTKGTREYKKKPQRCFTHSSWKKADKEIQNEYKWGKSITGICYSTGLGQYFVVMTETSQEQRFHWFDVSDTATRDDWMDAQHKEGFHPTIIFKDVTDDQTLVVMTKDENRSGYSCRFNQRMADPPS
ncbi:uncharacterized protein LOC110046712 [Orbicella faveolata]|uniref:uncharacterized protein LOC110046712 n=1 Tax=Orbicella faveolata TaxID=48498 RepID=UPI0009E61BB2|nr:uncharacterized protein LOC110046712 [Orbicella faveolata]